MVDLGLPQIVQNLKSQTWSDEVRNKYSLFSGYMLDFLLNQILSTDAYVLSFQIAEDFHNFILQDLVEALTFLEEGLKDSIRKLSSFDKYKQEVMLGNLDWSPMHKDPAFWSENITKFEDNDFQVC